MVIAIMLQMCTRLGLIKCKRQGEPTTLGYESPGAATSGHIRCLPQGQRTAANSVQVLSSALSISPQISLGRGSSQRLQRDC